MSSSFLIYLFVGKLFIYLGMRFASSNNLTKGFIGKLFACDECLGVWVYGILSFLLGEHLFSEYFYVPFISELVTGGLSSIIIHLTSLGWKQKFEVIVIE